MSIHLLLNRATIVAILFFALLACGGEDEAGDIIKPSNSIVDFVESNPNYSSLNAALIATNLKADFAGNGNFTLFAPTNAAFNAFLSVNDYSGLDAVPVELLRQILLNHFQEGVIYSTDFSTGYISSMATGDAAEENLSLYINTENGIVINGVSIVTTPNLEVDNGVIHAVNALIELPDITTFIIADPTFEILEAALSRDEIFNFMSTLQTHDSPAPFTVFAPNNNAFVNLLEELELGSVDEIPSNVLASALNYHIVAGTNLHSGDITDGMEITTLESRKFIANSAENITITDENDRMATLLAFDIQATNGIIQVIDTVLLPKR